MVWFSSANLVFTVLCEADGSARNQHNQDFLLHLTVARPIPIVSIADFSAFGGQSGFYAERLSIHIRHHTIIHHPHKHNFYLAVLFTRGSGTHEVDFTTWTIRPGSLFLLNPGQIHRWQLSHDADGYIFFHTREFYDAAFTRWRLHDLPFYSSIHHAPVLNTSVKQAAVTRLFGQLVDEWKSDANDKAQRLLALLHLLYLELTRLYTPLLLDTRSAYPDRFRQFEQLLDQLFKTMKLPGEYARHMSITERHLNRITRLCVGKSPSQLIRERVVLEAKRILAHRAMPVSDVAGELGYDDPSYFSRLFRQATGQSPSAFAGAYRR